MSEKAASTPTPEVPEVPAADRPEPAPEARPKEYGGPRGLEPTRFGDWERKGRCIDF